MILLIESATQICSVALAHDGKIVAERHSDQPNAHSSMLAVFIDELFKELKNQNSKHLHTLTPSHLNLDAVCVSSGPGSYTGLRIGVSSAKGIAYALGIPMLAIPTLQNMAMHYYATHPNYDGLVCPMIDARRMECYTAIFSRDKMLRDTQAQVIEEGLFDQWLNESPVTFIGDGAEKTRPILSFHLNALYDNSFQISAAGMIHEAERKLLAGEKEDVAYFEPFYLKDFIAKKSIVHGLH